MKNLSLKLNDDVFKETESIVSTLKMPRNAYINEAVYYFNKVNHRKILKEKLQRESGLAKKSSIEILEELEKKGDLKAMSKIVEAPGFVQHFQKSPHGWTMAALGSPIYGAMMGPYWNQVAGMANGGGYFGGPQAYFPEKHFSMYGSGFSSLPVELGGQIPGTASRATGTPMA
jgi:hypothetical protein